MMRAHRHPVRAPLRRRDRVESVGADPRLLGRDCVRRWTCFRNSFRRRSTFRPRRPGFAPQQVEELVTKQVENAVNGAAGLATLRSESIPGLSVVTITFADGVDVHVARQGISERLSELGSSLPAGVGTPEALAAGLEHHGPAQDRPAVRQGRCLCAARHGRLDHQAAAAGRSRRRARHRVRRRCPADPNSAGHAQAGELRHHPDRRGGCRARRAAAARRRVSSISPASACCSRSPTPQPDIDAIGEAVVDGAQRHAHPAARRRAR